MKNIRHRIGRFQRAGRRFSPALASLSILALLWTGRAWAENYPLDNIDFVSVNRQTNIILHTGSIVPVQKVLVSDSKLILDIDQIEATDTIRTNFTGAGNISHVILQPLNEHKIRLIIRGSDLGRPSLAFYSTNSGSYSATNLTEPEPGEAAIPFKTAPESEISAESASSASLSGASTDTPSASRRDMASEGAPTPTLTLPLEGGGDNIESSHNNVESSQGGDIQASQQGNIESLQKNAPSRTSATRPLTDISPLPPSEAPAKSGNSNNNMLESLLSLPWSGYLPYALLGGLLLGLGLFVRNRLARIAQADPQLEELLDAKRADDGLSGKRSSFREMADAYRSKREGRSAPESGRLPVTSARRTDAKDVIGLHSLEQSFPEAEPGPDDSLPSSPTGRASGRTPHQAAATAPAPAVSLEQLLAALQKAQAVQGGAVKPSASPKSRPTVNPYAPPQASSPKKSRTPATSGSLPATERPDLQQKAAPVNQALAARKNASGSPSISPFVPPSVSSAAQAGGKSGPVSMPSAKSAAIKPESARVRQGDMQGPLPGNPEVLNFLRNVADLMEKDGKTDIAQNIHKKLNNQSLGLVR